MLKLSWCQIVIIVLEVLEIDGRYRIEAWTICESSPLTSELDLYFTLQPKTPLVTSGIHLEPRQLCISPSFYNLVNCYGTNTSATSFMSRVQLAPWGEEMVSEVTQ